MVKKSAYYVPSVENYGEDIELEEVRELLSENGVDAEINERPKMIEYRGDRMEYIFWSNSVLQRDYSEGYMSERDLVVVEVAQKLTDNNLKMPPTTNTCP